MPIAHSANLDFVHTILAGRVTDEEVHAYYAQLPFMALRHPWREVVDGRAMTELAVTVDGHRVLMRMLSDAPPEAMLGARVAMVAVSDEAYGMFRMWELMREGFGYEVNVFRDYDAAVRWMALDAVPVARAGE